VNQPLFKESRKEQLLECLSNLQLIFDRSIKNFTNLSRHNRQKQFLSAVDEFLEIEKRYLIWRALVGRGLARRIGVSVEYMLLIFDQKFISKAQIGNPKFVIHYPLD